MATLTLVESQRTLLGIISGVEAGVTSPAEAVEELETLKANAPQTFKADYTFEDFERIGKNAGQSYASSTDDVETEPYESSYKSSY